MSSSVRTTALPLSARVERVYLNGEPDPTEASWESWLEENSGDAEHMADLGLELLLRGVAYDGGGARPLARFTVVRPRAEKEQTCGACGGSYPITDPGGYCPGCTSQFLDEACET